MYKIDCVKYRWDEGTESNEINFFSDETPTEIETIDLYEYLIRDSMSDIEYSFVNTDESNTLLIQASTVTMKCIDSNNSGTSLIDFFELYETDSRIKFKINVYDDRSGEYFYTGVLRKDGISVIDRFNSVLDLQVIGYEKEFADFFTEPLLIPSGDIPAAILPLAINLTGQKEMQLVQVLQRNFPNVQFDFMFDTSHFLYNFYCVTKPYTYSPSSVMGVTNFFHTQTGYDSFTLDEVDKFTFFHNLCLSEGWNWFFYLGVMYILKRADSTLTELNIDANDTFITHGISNVINDYAINTIIFNAGEYYGSEDSFTYQSTFNVPTHYLGGNRSIAISDKKQVYNIIRPFHALAFNSALAPFYTRTYTGAGPVFYYTANSEEESDWRYELRKYFLFTTPGTEVDFQKLPYIKNNTIKINMHLPSRDNSGILDTSQARTTNGTFYGNGNTFGQNHDFGDNGFGYTCHAGGSLIKYDSSTDSYLNYESRSQTDEFINNQMMLLSGDNNLILDIELNQVVKNPLQYVTIDNYSYHEFSDYKFAINKLSFNLFQGTSKLQISRINE